MAQIMIIAAHPDDEVVGCASRILREKNTIIVYIVTYNEIRKNEAKMMALFAGLKEKNLIFLDYKPEDLLKRNVVKAVKEKIKEVIKKNKPSEVYIPSYEGGHIHHDITNYVVNKAVSKSKIDSKVYEFPMYNNYPKYAMQKMLRRLSLYMPLPHNHPQRFVPVNGSKITNTKMTKDEMRLKKHMLRIYKSQNKNDLLVKMFWYPEKYRICPKYDYRRKPHPGPLNYEITTKLRFKDFINVIE